MKMFIIHCKVLFEISVKKADENQYFDLYHKILVFPAKKLFLSSPI